MESLSLRDLNFTIGWSNDNADISPTLTTGSVVWARGTVTQGDGSVRVVDRRLTGEEYLRLQAAAFAFLECTHA
jgi:hypothetical protein